MKFLVNLLLPLVFFVSATSLVHAEFPEPAKTESKPSPLEGGATVTGAGPNGAETGEATTSASEQPSGIRSGPAPLDRILAVVNNDVITQSDVKLQTRTVLQQLREKKAQIPPDDILQKQVLERAIMRQLQLQLAESTGIRVDDDALNRAIEMIAKQNNLTLDQFREVLAKDGFDFAAFREDIRKEIIISRLRQREIGNKINVTDQEVENYLANQKAQGATAGDEYQLAHILIAVPAEASPEQVKAAKGKAEKVLASLRSGADFKETAAAVSSGEQALEGGDLGWRSGAQLPTIFANVVTTMKPGDISEPIRSPSGFHIIKLVDKRGGDSASVVKQTQVRHILIHTNELTSDKDAETRLKQLKQRIDGGEDFAGLARSHSEDAASAVNGGSLGWVSPGNLMPQFEAVMNDLAPGQTSEPFQTQFGWHIVQVMERRDHDNTDDLKKSKAREAIRQRKGDEQLQAWLRTLRDEAYIEFKTEEE